jgi:hypothetical protein
VYGLTLFSANIAFSFLVGFYSKKYFSTQANAQLNISTIALGIFLLGFLYAVNLLIINFFERRAERKIRSSIIERRRILGLRNVIEGRWIVRTKVGNKILEYALVTISFSEGELHLDGDLYCKNDVFTDSDGKPTGIFGKFRSEVAKYYDESEVFKYSYSRFSEYENNYNDNVLQKIHQIIEKIDCDYSKSESAIKDLLSSSLEEGYPVQTSTSQGSGAYRFNSPLENGLRVEFSGYYFDPKTDAAHEVTGKNIDFFVNAIGLQSSENRVLPNSLSSADIESMKHWFEITFSERVPPPILSFRRQALSWVKTEWAKIF